MTTHYIVLVGGVYSGQGKGMACSSLAFLLKQRGYNVTCMKLDAYLNESASLNPAEHGETFVTDDGCETDLDLGAYERLGTTTVGRKNIWTSGALYQELLVEQDTKYLGKTLQVVPHFSNKIQEKIREAGEGHDICIIELGGSVGDIESAGFYEAIRQFRQKERQNCLVGMLAPIFWIQTIKEFKTKPLQRAVKDLQSYGIQPDFLFCRVDRVVPDSILDKVSSLTNVSRDAVFDLIDVDNVYKIPIEFYNRKIDSFVIDMFNLKRTTCRIHKYKELIERELPTTVQIGIVGKYQNCEEAYVSIKHALYHAGVANGAKVRIRWLSAEQLESIDSTTDLQEINGLIIPGGFDKRGVEGKIKAIRYARENKLPFLGICLGLQCAVIEFARHVGITNANSIEFDKNTENPVVHFVPGQESIRKKSGTMRLGAYDCVLEKDSLARRLFKKKSISERHRHRYEVNSDYESVLAEGGFNVSGRHPESGLIEIMEMDQNIHPFFTGIQSHPEFKSRLGEPHPLFDGLVSHALKHKGQQ